MTERMRRREARREKGREDQPERHPAFGNSSILGKFASLYWPKGSYTSNISPSSTETAPRKLKIALIVTLSIIAVIVTLWLSEILLPYRHEVYAFRRYIYGAITALGFIVIIASIYKDIRALIRKDK